MKIRVTYVIDVDPQKWADNNGNVVDAAGRFSAAGVREDVRTYILTNLQGLPLLEDSTKEIRMTTIDRKETDYATARRVALAAEDTARAQALPGFVRQAKDIGADFTLDVYTAAQLTAVLDAIGGHNNYNPQRAGALLGPFVDEAMRVRVEHFVAGPAIYFQIPYTEQQRIAARYTFAPAVRLSDDERNDLAQRVLDAGEELNADERSSRQQDGDASVVWNKPGPRPYEIRLWWD